MALFFLLGAEVYVLMQRFVNAQVSAKALLNHDAITTWFSDWQVAHGRVSHLQIRVIINNVKIAIDELGYIEKCLSTTLNNVYDKNTVDEWLGTYLDPLMKQLCETRDRGNRVLGMVFNKKSFVTFFGHKHFILIKKKKKSPKNWIFLTKKKLSGI